MRSGWREKNVQIVYYVYLNRPWYKISRFARVLILHDITLWYPSWWPTSPWKTGQHQYVSFTNTCYAFQWLTRIIKDTFSNNFFQQILPFQAPKIYRRNNKQTPSRLSDIHSWGKKNSTDLLPPIISPHMLYIYNYQNNACECHRQFWICFSNLYTPLKSRSNDVFKQHWAWHILI